MTTSTNPLAGRRFVDEGGSPVVPGEYINEGGEGWIYTVDGDPDAVVKVWKPGRTPDDADAKLRYLVANPVTPELGANWRITWPQHIVLENGAIAGYVMPKLDYTLPWIPIVEYYNRSAARGTGAGQSRAIQIDDRVRIASNLALGYRAVHEAGYVIGDINEKNAEANRQNDVALMDCDSYGFTDAATGRTFSNNMGRPEFQAPEAQNNYANRTQEQDRFALAVLIFQLLTGYHPLHHHRPACSGLLSARRADQQLAVPAGRPGVTAPDPYNEAWDTLTDKQKELFLRCFDERRKGRPRPTPEEWVEALMEMPTVAPQPRRYPSHGHNLSRRHNLSHQPRPQPPPTPNPAQPQPNPSHGLSHYHASATTTGLYQRQYRLALLGVGGGRIRGIAAPHALQPVPAFLVAGAAPAGGGALLSSGSEAAPTAHHHDTLGLIGIASLTGVWFLLGLIGAAISVWPWWLWLGLGSGAAFILLVPARGRLLGSLRSPNARQRWIAIGGVSLLALFILVGMGSAVFREFEDWQLRRFTGGRQRRGRRRRSGRRSRNLRFADQLCHPGKSRRARVQLLMGSAGRGADRDRIPGRIPPDADGNFDSWIRGEPLGVTENTGSSSYSPTTMDKPCSSGSMRCAMMRPRSHRTSLSLSSRLFRPARPSRRQQRPSRCADSPPTSAIPTSMPTSGSYTLIGTPEDGNLAITGYTRNGANCALMARTPTGSSGSRLTRMKPACKTGQIRAPLTDELMSTGSLRCAIRRTRSRATFCCTLSRRSAAYAPDTTPASHAGGHAGPHAIAHGYAHAADPTPARLHSPRSGWCSTRQNGKPRAAAGLLSGKQHVCPQFPTGFVGCLGPQPVRWRAEVRQDSHQHRSASYAGAGELLSGYGGQARGHP